MPVAVDLSRRLETEEELIRVTVRCGSVLIDVAFHRVTSLPVPLDHVRIALEACDADAEVVELIREFSGELLDQGLVCVADARLRHGLCDHLRHLITRDLVVAPVRAVAVAFDDAVRSELRNGIVSPVVSGYVCKRVRCCKRRGCCADDESRRQCRYKSLLHKTFLLAKKQ